MDRRQRKIDTCNIGHKTQKDRHGQHWTQDTERHPSNIGHKTQKDTNGKHRTPETER